MRKLIFSHYESTKDNQTKLETLDWSDWVDLFSCHEIRGKLSDSYDKKILDAAKDGPAIVLGEVDGKRKAANVRCIHALALDVENKTDVEISAVLDTLAPFEWCLYSTHKHRAKAVDGQARLRIILPLAEFLSPTDFPAAWQGLQRLVKGANDPSTKDLARLHFLPSTFDPALALAHHNSGAWISVEDLRTQESTLIEKIWEKASHLKKEDPLRWAFEKLRRGDAFAPEGTRHDTALKMTLFLARKNPDLLEAEIEKLFEKSLAKMSGFSLAEILTAYEGALKRGIGNTNTYSTSELQIIAEKQNCTPPELRERWLVQKGTSFWFLTSAGEHEGPYTKDEALAAAGKILTRAPIRLYDATQNGYRYRSLTDLIRDHGSIAAKVNASLSAQVTTFDPQTRILEEAVVPIRKELSATFSPEIDGWLKTFGPAYPKLVDWLSCASDLTKSLCAIYFDGPKEVGKTLFALGVARIWTEGGCAEVEQVLNNFNEELVRCPLVFADEDIPKHFGGQSASAKLRALLGIKERTLKRKYLSNSNLTGALRLVLAANNEGLLDDLDAQSTADLEAIAQRFFYVNAGKEPIAYLARFAKQTLESWATRGIAEHALWLAENHVVEKPGRRFWVEGEMAQTHRLLLTGGQWPSMVCEWLIRYLINPKPLHADAEANGLVRIENGLLLVNEQVIVDKWKLYLPATRQDPVTRQIGQALKAISEIERKQLRWARRQIRYRVVIPSHLVAWSERYGIADEQLILDRIAGVLPLDVPALTQENIENKESDANEDFEGF